jgi:ribosomal protein L29
MTEFAKKSDNELLKELSAARKELLDLRLKGEGGGRITSRSLKLAVARIMTELARRKQTK